MSAETAIKSNDTSLKIGNDRHLFVQIAETLKMLIGTINKHNFVIGAEILQIRQKLRNLIRVFLDGERVKQKDARLDASEI